jgi:predicted O-methyltransferase YrrM
MDTNETTKFIASLYKYCLRREPGTDELQLWTNNLSNGASISSVIEQFGTCDEYLRVNGVKQFFEPGHYYSPIVSPDEEVRAYMLAQPKRVGASPAAIDMALDRMKSFFEQNAEFMSSATFPKDKNGNYRYYYDNGGYPLGDAITLRMIINALRPTRIIEVGSGFSTACMLDTADEIGLKPTITCIEPYADRLRNLLRPNDNVEILECPVQKVPLRRFEELSSGDVLFIDSTHVLKTGSDVHYELFEILPILKPGVLIHFHDIVYPFEYPLDWVFKSNYSWNEAYAVRAFLMYNDAFTPFYSNSVMAQLQRPLVERLYPGFPENPGSNLWIERVK